MLLNQMKILITTLGLLTASQVTLGNFSSVFSDDSVPPRGVDDFTEPPPPSRSHHHSHYSHQHQHHSHPYNHHHHHHHHHHPEERREYENHHFQNYQQYEQQTQQQDDEPVVVAQQIQIQQQQHGNEYHEMAEKVDEHQEQPYGYQRDQDDSPYYAGYTTINKYNHNVHGNCRLPDSWKGKWFQSGTQNPIQIDGKSIEGKGTCYTSSGDKFLFVEKGNCHRCVVINQRHLNVLEYKESSYCEDKNTLENLCSLIPGDASLYSLFRVDAQPIVCPFKGPYTFTYNRGHGLCKNPVSHVDTCTEPSRLLLRYQACPDVPKSESYEEELQCLAQWRDSTYHYLVGKLNYRLAVSNEERYRCFIYETLKSHTVVKIAVSGDATCTGLASPYEGAKTLTFTKVNEGGSKCKFPNWVSSHHWHSLDGKLSVKTNHKNSTMHIMDNSARDSGASSSSSSSSAIPSSSSSSSSLGHHHHHHLHNTNPGVGGGIYNSGNFGNSVTSFGIGNPYSLFSGGTRITCQASKELSDDHVAVVAQHTEGCTSTTVCMHFYKRDSHVIELQIRKKGSGYYDDSDECGKPEAFGPNLPYVTLIRAEVNSHRCPYLGKYMTTGVSQDGRLFAGGVDLCLSSGTNNGGSNVAQSHQHGAFHSVVVGCGQRATMDFHSKCVSQEPITSYECHGSWEENGTGFLIASPLSRSSTSASRFCFTYLETEDEGPAGLQFFSSSESCRRDVSPNVEGIWAFNLTVDGQCAEPMTGGAARSTQYCDLYSSPSYILAILVLLTFYTCSFSNITTMTIVSMSNTSIATTTNISTLVSDLFYSLFAKILSFSSSSLSSSSRRISSSTTSTSLLTSHNRHHHPDPNPTRQQPQYQHHSSRRMTLA